MAPKVDQVNSDPGLFQRYDELYTTGAFKSRLHNIVTTSRALLLLSAPGVGSFSRSTTRRSPWPSTTSMRPKDTTGSR